MSLIPKAPAPPDKESIPVRLDRSLHAQLRDYAAFVQGTKDYVITGALQRLFKGDREFADWLQKKGKRSSIAPEEAPAATSASTALPAAASAAGGPQPPSAVPIPRQTRERA